ncbi:MAG: exodeoxyribonuclease V subunit beta [Bacteroidota bacterium]
MDNKMNLLKPFDIDMSGINLVEASAGTGKTYNIASLYIRTLIERDIAVGKILVVTYTDAATKELKDRLLERIRLSIRTLKSGAPAKEDDDFLQSLLTEVEHPKKAVAKLKEAVRTFDEASVYTIHGFCYHALQEQAFESRAMYDAEMIGDDQELVQEAVDDYWRNWVDEVSQNAEMKPLLKLLLDKKVNPDALTDELKKYIGKPYLHVLPEGDEISDLDALLGRFGELHLEMKKIWSEERSELWELLSRDEMSNYRSDWLEGWFEKVDGIFNSEIPKTAVFDKFERFFQSYINDSLKVDAVKKGVQPPQHEFFVLAEEYSQIAHSLKGFQPQFKKELLTYLRNELNQKKEELQVLSYDDLLLRLRNALKDEQRGKRLADKLRQKYPIAMVDEFQDTDPSQYDIFRTIYKDSDGTLFMIGDPKQSIYSFRGADVYAYIRARKDAPHQNRYKLNRNFRSTPQLLRGLNTFWESHDDPFASKGDIQYKSVHWGKPEDSYQIMTEFGEAVSPIRFRRLTEGGENARKKDEARRRVAEDTAEEIKRLIEGGKAGDILIGNDRVEAKDIAVLVRKHKQANLISEALQASGIKSVRHSDQSVFESDEAEHLEQMLKAVAEPGNEKMIKTALSLPLTGYSAAELYSIEEDENEWLEMRQQFADWHRMWQDHGFSAMYRSLLSGLGVQEHVIGYTDGERRLTNLMHLGELLEEESGRHGEGARGLLHWLARKRKDTDENKNRDEEQLRLESDEDLVKIVTMHKSKGLQYPIVFCPYLSFGPRIQDKGWAITYHDQNDPDIVYLDLNGKEGANRSRRFFYKQKEELAESLRLAYVAMTRAEQCLYLTWEYANDTEFSSLAYLLQNPENSIALLKEKVGFEAGGDVSFDADAVHQKIGDLCEEKPELFTLKVESDSLDDGSSTKDDGDRVEFATKMFSRCVPIETGYSVSSFSSLSSWMDDHDPDLPDYDQYIDYGEVDIVSNDYSKQTIFTFPRGPQPGTCIHNIFENYFSNSGDRDKVITNQLQLNGIDGTWKNTVSQMLDTVLDKTLHPNVEGLTLSAVQSRQIPEMEFYYYNEEIKTRELLSIIRNESISQGDNKGRAAAGFLKGFIDLTFEYNGKYYLLDYKTNHLGDTISSYSYKELDSKMKEAFYDLQYHIYTVALHRFLKQRITDYSYENHFGGAFYLFLRGINKEGREGIFFDRPHEKTIIRLNEYIKGRSHE